MAVADMQISAAILAFLVVAFTGEILIA